MQSWKETFQKQTENVSDTLLKCLLNSLNINIKIINTIMNK